MGETPDERYARQTLIPDWDQTKLKESTVLILGVGATGSFTATNLAMSGVGKLILVDFDTIEISNLNRQLLFRPEDIGENKAVIAADRLQQLNPDIEIVAFPEDMVKLSKATLQGVTAIACCLDSFGGRRWANSLALREKVPMVSGGMYAFLGNVQTIIPYETACFECQPLISQEKLAQACTPLGMTRKEMELEKEEPKLPSVATLSSIIAGFISQELLKLILQVGSPLENYFFYDGLNNGFTHMRLERNDSCPICGTGIQLENLPALVFPGEKVAKFKERVALAFGMADPRLMIKGRFLEDTDDLMVEEGTKIYAMDERLASPIVIIATISTEEQ